MKKEFVNYIPLIPHQKFIGHSVLESSKMFTFKKITSLKQLQVSFDKKPKLHLIEDSSNKDSIKSGVFKNAIKIPISQLKNPPKRIKSSLISKIPHPINKIQEYPTAKNKEISQKENSNKDNYSFDFDAFIEIKNDTISPRKKSPSYSKENIHYLSPYSKNIRENIIYEQKVNNKIEKVNKILKEKELMYNSLQKHINSLFTQIENNKITHSHEIDNYIQTVINIEDNITNNAMFIDQKDKIEQMLSNAEKKENKLKYNIDKLGSKLEQDNIYINKKAEKYLYQLEMLNKDIKELKVEKENLIKKNIDYFLSLLQQGTDVRSEGLSWIVKNLILMKFMPNIKHFPKFFDNDSMRFVIDIAKRQIQIMKTVEQLQKLKNKILTKLNSKEFIGKKINSTKGIEAKNELYIKNKMEKLLKNNDYFHVTPFQMNKIQIGLHNKEIKKYLTKVKELNRNGELFFYRAHSAKIKEFKINKKFNIKTIETESITNKSNSKIAMLQEMLNLKKKINDNEYYIEKIKAEKYLHHKKLNSSNELMNALFGSNNRIKFGI